MNTIAHSIARFSPLFCNDIYRLKSLFVSEPEFWTKYYLPASRLARRWIEPFDPSDDYTISNHLGLMRAKVDYTFVDNFAVVDKAMLNADFALSDHKLLLLKLAFGSDSGSDSGCSCSCTCPVCAPAPLLHTSSATLPPAVASADSLTTTTPLDNPARQVRCANCATLTHRPLACPPAVDPCAAGLLNLKVAKINGLIKRRVCCFTGIKGRYGMLQDLLSFVDSFDFRGHKLIFGDMNTIAHSIARFSPLFCNDIYRLKSLFVSEPEFWTKYYLPASRLARRWIEPFDPSDDYTISNHLGLMRAKVDYTFVDNFAVVDKAMLNADFDLSDHKLLLLKLAFGSDSGCSCSCTCPVCAPAPLLHTSSATLPPAVASADSLTTTTPLDNPARQVRCANCATLTHRPLACPPAVDPCAAGLLNLKVAKINGLIKRRVCVTALASLLTLTLIFKSKK
ncbi:hypothetical protein AYI70_g2543 [Smittium culicis]|uniref:Endonuclease/exonuclease/phosphatase domain-containing protein n=1 Tax=Smittium culicis TaxID=133412 RepID=A0A1R1Y830_9FUNG|nr:hypothetical protein AYI70_g2543 [Smittium culicis]